MRSTEVRRLSVTALRRAAVADLLPEWRALHRRIPGLSPFADPDFQLVWCEQFVPAGRELVLAVRRGAGGEGGGDLVAVLPLFAPFGGPIGRMVRYLRPFGGHEALLHEMPEFSIDPAHARPALAAVVHWFGEHDDWDFVELSMRDDEPWVESRWLVDAGLDTAVQVHKKAYPSIVLTLPAGVAVPPLKRNLKESLRRSRNRMGNSPGKWEARRTVPGDDDWSAALDDLVRLHGERSRMGADAPAHIDLFAGTSQRAYLDALAAVVPVSSARPVVHRLTRDDVAVAALLTFEYPQGTWISASGTSPGHWRLGGVTALQWEAVQRAVGHGSAAVVFSVGIDTAKLRWSETVRVRNGFLFSHSRRRSRWLFRAYWLYFQYRGSLIDVVPYTSGRQRRADATGVTDVVPDPARRPSSLEP